MYLNIVWYNSVFILPGDHKSVLKKYKKILKGVPADQITDSDIPLEKFRKRKRTKVDFSTSSSQNTLQHQCSREEVSDMVGYSYTISRIYIYIRFVKLIMIMILIPGNVLRPR